MRADHVQNLQRLLQAEKREVMSREMDLRRALLQLDTSGNETVDNLQRHTDALQGMFARLEQSIQSLATTTKDDTALLVVTTSPDERRTLSSYPTTPTNNRAIHWKKSNHTVAECNMLDLLDISPLQSGSIVKWSLHVEGKAELRAGVVLSTKANSQASFGSQAGMWAYGSWGDAWYDGQRTWHRKYGTGSVVTFTLDLTGSGTLVANVDGHNAEIIFTNLAKEMQMLVNAATIGVLPAVWCNTGTTVQILGMEVFEKMNNNGCPRSKMIDQQARRWIEDAD